MEKAYFKIIFLLPIFLSGIDSFGQNTVKIKVTVPDKSDEVFITGNQLSLGDWNPSKVKMLRVSDFERELSLNLDYPAQFKFTRGSWETEGKINSYFDTDSNIQITDPVKTAHNFTIKSWIDKLPTSDSFIQSYHLESSYSKVFNQVRDIAVYLPNNFKPEKKYSVVYVLDAYSWFKNFVLNTEMLSKNSIGEDVDYGIDNIPEVIIVGVIHKDRNYETSPNLGQKAGIAPGILYEGSQKLKDYLSTELVPFINTKFNTSGYNIIFGHSNTGHFVLNLACQPKTPFSGFIALSVNGESKIFNDKLTAHLLGDRTDNIYIGYGKMDNGFNELAMELQQKVSKSEIVNSRLKIDSFETTHNQIPQLALNPALKFMFKDYKNNCDFSELANQKEFSLDDYFTKYIKKNSVYGVQVEINNDLMLTLLEQCVATKNIKVFRDLLNYDSQHENIKISNQLIVYYSKEIEDFESADIYLKNILLRKDPQERDMVFYNLQSTFLDYYLNRKNKPQEALHFLETLLKQKGKYELEFSFFYAKIGIENKLEYKKSRNYLKFIEKNFSENRYFSMIDLQKLKTKSVL